MGEPGAGSGATLGNSEAPHGSSGATDGEHPSVGAPKSHSVWTIHESGSLRTSRRPADGTDNEK